MTPDSVRPYQPSDRADVERICLATGLGGALEKHFCDQEVFVKVWLSPFLDSPLGQSWVAVEEGKVVGYLVGTYEPHFNRRALRWLLPPVVSAVARWLTGRYRHHPPSGRFLKWMLLHSWREHPKTPRDSCHFHFNLDPAVKGDWHGVNLGRTFIEEARRRGKPCWHAVVFTGVGGKKKRKFYEKMGFTIYDSRPSRLLGDGAELTTIMKELGPESTSLID